MADTFRIGPALLFLGNPTTPAGAGMTYLGLTKGDITVAPNIKIAMGQADQTGRTPRADAIYRVGSAPVVGAPLLDEAKDILKLQLPGSSVVTAGGKTALGLGSGFSKIQLADVPTLAVIPVDETDEGTNGIDAPTAIWLPAAICNQCGEMVFNLPDEGDDSVFNPRDVQFAGLRRATDHAAATIPDAAKVAFIGPPAAHGLTWYLPAVSL